MIELKVTSLLPTRLDKYLMQELRLEVELEIIVKKLVKRF